MDIIGVYKKMVMSLVPENLLKQLKGETGTVGEGIRYILIASLVSIAVALISIVLNLVLQGESPKGSMTLAEEEFHNRIQRGLSSHDKFVGEVLAGSPTPTIKRTGKKKKTPEPEKEPDIDSDEMEYVMVRFLRPVEDSFVGLDEIEYGPFEEEVVATIPTANARVWLRDGTVVRVAPTRQEEK